MPWNEILAFALPTIATLFVLRRHARSFSLSQPTLMSVVFFLDYIFLFSAGITYYTFVDNNDQYVLFSALTRKYSISIASASVFFFIIVFFEFSRFIETNVKKYLNNRLSNIKSVADSNLALAALVIFSAITTALFIGISLQERIGVFSYLSTSQADIAVARTTFTLGGGASQVLRMISFYWIPMLSYTWLYLLLSTRIYDRKNLFLIMSIIFIMLSILATISGFEKSRLVFYVIGLIGVWIYSGRRVVAIYWILSIAFALFVVIFGYFLYGASININFIINMITHRVSIQSAGAILAFDWYPDVLPFKGLAGLSKFLASMLHQNFSTPYADIIDRWDPPNAATSGSMASFATGEAYGLFGWSGVLVSPFVAALYFGSLEATKHVAPIKPMCAAAYGLFFGMPFLATGFYSFLWPLGFVYAFVPFVLIGIVAALERDKYN